ncbi:MAG: hypothetical protein HC860_11450 [Alkalinema sp. RU_4_3]|nr:hypothetical protein [Alkalinema sp. RU_4_3]
MTYQAALQKIEQAAAEQWEELDLSGMGLTEVRRRLGVGGVEAVVFGEVG